MSDAAFTPRSRTGTGPTFRAARPVRSVRSTIREFVLIGTMFMLYLQVRTLTSGDVEQATSNANRVVGIERWFGAFSEESVQRAALRSRLVIELLDHYYVFVHFTASFGFMAWIFLRHPDAWARIRTWFLAVTLTGLVIHVLFPLAPPRMLSQYGFVDTLHVYGPSIYSRDVTASAANQLAAMPSLHFAWSVLVAAGVISVLRSRLRFVVLLHPFVTLMAIVATANHYWLDAAVGGVLVTVTLVVGRVVAHRARPVAIAPLRSLPALAEARLIVHLPRRQVARCVHRPTSSVCVAERMAHRSRQVRRTMPTS